MGKQFRVGILGATGVVGQRFIQLLQNHPQFEVTALAVAPLHAKFGVTSCVVTTMQALSGVGYPGVPSLDATDNVIPYIGGEEEKVEAETLKILGTINQGEILDADMKVSAQCNRVN